MVKEQTSDKTLLNIKATIVIFLQMVIVFKVYYFFH